MNRMSLSIQGKNIVRSYGGVLVDKEQRVLLRSPTNHFDGYVWTFAKGRMSGNEIPEAAALREVLEETGYYANIVMKLPGEFRGGTGVTEYFLMQPIGSPVPFDWETAEIRWVNFDEAQKLIAMSSNVAGVLRDQNVLKAAILTVEALNVSG